MRKSKKIKRPGKSVNGVLKELVLHGRFQGDSDLVSPFLGERYVCAPCPRPKQLTEHTSTPALGVYLALCREWAAAITSWQAHAQLLVVMVPQRSEHHAEEWWLRWRSYTRRLKGTVGCLSAGMSDLVCAMSRSGPPRTLAQRQFPAAGMTVTFSHPLGYEGLRIGDSSRVPWAARLIRRLFERRMAYMLLVGSMRSSLRLVRILNAERTHSAADRRCRRHLLPPHLRGRALVNEFVPRFLLAALQAHLSAMAFTCDSRFRTHCNWGNRTYGAMALTACGVPLQLTSFPIPVAAEAPITLDKKEACGELNKTVDGGWLQPTVAGAWDSMFSQCMFSVSKVKGGFINLERLGEKEGGGFFNAQFRPERASELSFRARWGFASSSWALQKGEILVWLRAAARENDSAARCSQIIHRAGQAFADLHDSSEGGVRVVYAALLINEVMAIGGKAMVGARAVLDASSPGAFFIGGDCWKGYWAVGLSPVAQAIHGALRVAPMGDNDERIPMEVAGPPPPSGHYFQPLKWAVLPMGSRHAGWWFQLHRTHKRQFCKHIDPTAWHWVMLNDPMLSFSDKAVLEAGRFSTADFKASNGNCGGTLGGLSAMVPGGFNPHWSVGIVPFASDGLEAVQSKVFVDDWALMVGNQGNSSHRGDITKASPRCYQASRMSVHASHRFNLINNEPDNENKAIEATTTRFPHLGVLISSSSPRSSMPFAEMPESKHHKLIGRFYEMGWRIGLDFVALMDSFLPSTTTPRRVVYLCTYPSSGLSKALARAVRPTLVRRWAMSLMGYANHVGFTVVFLARCLRELTRDVYKGAYGQDGRPSQTVDIDGDFTVSILACSECLMAVFILAIGRRHQKLTRVKQPWHLLVGDACETGFASVGINRGNGKIMLVQGAFGEGQDMGSSSSREFETIVVGLREAQAVYEAALLVGTVPSAIRAWQNLLSVPADATEDDESCLEVWHLSDNVPAVRGGGNMKSRSDQMQPHCDECYIIAAICNFVLRFMWVDGFETLGNHTDAGSRGDMTELVKLKSWSSSNPWLRQDWGLPTDVRATLEAELGEMIILNDVGALAIDRLGSDLSNRVVCIVPPPFSLISVVDEVEEIADTHEGVTIVLVVIQDFCTDYNLTSIMRRFSRGANGRFYRRFKASEGSVWPRLVAIKRPRTRAPVGNKEMYTYLGILSAHWRRRGWASMVERALELAAVHSAAEHVHDGSVLVRAFSTGLVNSGSHRGALTGSKCKDHTACLFSGYRADTVVIGGRSWWGINASISLAWPLRSNGRILQLVTQVQGTVGNLRISRYTKDWVLNGATEGFEAGRRPTAAAKDWLAVNPTWIDGGEGTVIWYMQAFFRGGEAPLLSAQDGVTVGHPYTPSSNQTSLVRKVSAAWHGEERARIDRIPVFTGWAFSKPAASPLPSCWPSAGGQESAAAFQLWAARQHKGAQDELCPPVGTTGYIRPALPSHDYPFARWCSRRLRPLVGNLGPPTSGDPAHGPSSSPQPQGAERAFALGLGAAPPRFEGGNERQARSRSGRHYDTGLLRIDRALTSMVDARSTDHKSICSSCQSLFITTDGLVCRLADRVEPFAEKKGMQACGTRTCLDCFNEWAQEDRYFDWTGKPQNPLTKYHTRMAGSHVCEHCRIKLISNSSVPVEDPAHHEYLLELVRQYLIDLLAHLADGTTEGYARQVNIMHDFSAAVPGLDRGLLMGIEERDLEQIAVSTAHGMLWLHQANCGLKVDSIRKVRAAYGSLSMRAKRQSPLDSGEFPRFVKAITERMGNETVRCWAMTSSVCMALFDQAIRAHYGAFASGDVESARDRIMEATYVLGCFLLWPRPGEQKMITLRQVAKDICPPALAAVQQTEPHIKFILAAPTKRSRARAVGGVIAWRTWSGLQIGAAFERMILLQARTKQGLDVSWPHHSTKGKWTAHYALNGYLRPALLLLQGSGHKELQGVDIATATLRSFRRGGITHALDMAEPGNEYLIECHRRKAARRGKAATLPIIMRYDQRPDPRLLLVTQLMC